MAFAHVISARGRVQRDAHRCEALCTARALGRSILAASLGMRRGTGIARCFANDAACAAAAPGGPTMPRSFLAHACAAVAMLVQGSVAFAANLQTSYTVDDKALKSTLSGTSLTWLA